MPRLQKIQTTIVGYFDSDPKSKIDKYHCQLNQIKLEIVRGTNIFQQILQKDRIDLEDLRICQTHKDQLQLIKQNIEEIKVNIVQICEEHNIVYNHRYIQELNVLVDKYQQIIDKTKNKANKHPNRGDLFDRLQHLDFNFDDLEALERMVREIRDQNFELNMFDFD